MNRPANPFGRFLSFIMFSFIFNFVNVTGYNVYLERCGKADLVRFVDPLQIATYPMEIPGRQGVSLIGYTRDYWTSKRISNSQVDIKMKKKTWFGDMDIPCVSGFGSCKKQLQDLLPALANQLADGATKTELTYPNICIPDPGPLARIFVEGEYKVEIRLLADDYASEELGCVKFRLPVVHGTKRC